MNIRSLLQGLVLEDWSFWLDSGRLKFRAPKEKADQALIAKLKSCKEEIISLLQNEPEALNICPLSYGQRALWFLWKLAPQSTAYNQSLPLRIAYPADVRVWKECCHELVKRHPMLRTIFPQRQGEPLQQILSCPETLTQAEQRENGLEIDWHYTQAQGWKEDELQAKLQEAHFVPFDLEQGPLVRFNWYTRSKEEHLLLITMHHIICDGWSLQIMFQELSIAALYKDSSLGQADRQSMSGLRDLNSSISETGPEYTYCDYVDWQMDMLNSASGQRLWEFWEQELAGPLPVLDLPTDYPRPAVQTYDGDFEGFQLPGNLSHKLRHLAARKQVTLYVLFMAAYMLFLQRLTAQEDILVGSPDSGRSRIEFSDIVGYFVDPVVIRARIANKQSFNEFLTYMGQVVRRALDHAEYPFALLVERLQPERDPGRSPLFDVSMNYIPSSGSAGGDDGGQVQIFDIAQADGKFDLTLNIVEQEEAFKGSLGFNKNLFAKETVARFVKYFENILQQIAKGPEQDLAHFSLQDLRGKRFEPVLKGRDKKLDKKDLLQHLFEEQARKSADQIAVKAAGRELSYAQLNSRSNILAMELKKQGIGPESRVAICVGRSVDFIVALWAVLKSGGAYVPLDPEYPAQFLQTILHKAGVTTVIVQEDTNNWGFEADFLAIEDIYRQNDSQEIADPLPYVDLHNLAYVMFTSGSTGTPKGVSITQGNLSNYVLSILEDLNLEQGKDFALLSALNADLGNTAIFPCLCTGGCLHILSDEQRLDSQAFADYLQANNIDYLKIVPSHLSALLDSINQDRHLPCKTVILGGESASRDLVQKIYTHAPDCTVFNHYGPTETTVGVLTYQVRSADYALLPANLPLYKPVANTEIYLLDQQLNPVPEGIAGELHIAGASLARGYINEPELTAKSFISLDQAGDEQKTVYKTGDLARKPVNSDLEFLGRKDRQINIRGFRVELGQVEYLLNAHPEVAFSVALADREGDVAEHILAFVQAEDKSGPEGPGPQEEDTLFSGQGLARDLSAYLQERLPKQMLPAQVLVLPRIPLTANGKIDAHTLRQRAQASKKDGQNAKLSRPRDILELKLRRIWAEILGVEDISIDDDFFQSGGHSLLALRLAGRIYEQFGRRVSLAVLFKNPTVSKLARVLRSAAQVDNPLLVPLQQSDTGPNLFCLPGAGGNVLYFDSLASNLGVKQSIWALQGLGFGENELIPDKIEDFAARYIQIIQEQVQPKGPYYLLGHSFGAFTAFEMASQLLKQGEDIAFLGLIDNAAPGIGLGQEYTHFSHAKWLRHIAIRIEKLYNTDLSLDKLNLEDKDEDIQTETLIERLINSATLPSDLNKAHFKRFIKVYKANAMAAAFYQPQALPAPVRTVLFKAGKDDPDLKANRQTGLDLKDDLGLADQAEQEALGWNRFSLSPVEVVQVPGTHLTMLIEPNVQELAARIRHAVELVS